MKCRYIGIDPGDRWIGLAIFEVDGDVVYAESRVLDADARPFSILVDEIALAMPGSVVAEAYRVRSIGVNHFTDAPTARLLGALEYVSGKSNTTWKTVTPGPGKELKNFPLNDFLVRWRDSWPDAKNSQWRHALSAWRVLAIDWLQNRPTIHLSLAKSKLHSIETLTRFRIPVPNERIRRQTDLLAPTATWRLYENP